MISLLDNPERQRIAIIGSGISGLVCAHWLHALHDVTIFEANAYVGGHTNTIDVELDGERQAVDTGFIVFNDLNYPRFVRLLSELRVASQPSHMSFSVRCDQSGIEYNGTSLNTLFVQRRNIVRPSFLRMTRDILRFNREAIETLEMADTDMTVSEYVAERGYSQAFVEHYLVPMGTSIWSCPAGVFRRFPIRFVVEFMQNHVMLRVSGRPQWRVVTGGSQRYVEALTRPFRDRIRLSSPVHGIQRHVDSVEVLTRRDHVESFDHVIMACHADQALQILDDASPLERDVLSAFPYQPNTAILHTDTTVLPRRPRAWAAWNYRRHADGDMANAPTAITYNMNILQSLTSRHTFCVTLNDDASIDPKRVIDRFAYDHPVFTQRRAAAQAQHDDLIDVNRTSFCGAYWGFGFHEDGVRSGERVCAALERVPTA